MSSARGQRIEASCKTIWGDAYDYDLDIETDDYITYICFVKKDFGDSLGPPLIMTNVCNSDNAAWAELDRMLELWARVVRRGTPMTKEESLEFAGGPRGKHRQLVSKFMDESEKRERAEQKSA